MNNSDIHEYSKSTQRICLCSVISIMLILLFIISPINKWFMTSMFGKLVILILLGYTIFYNIQLTNNFSSQTGLYLANGNWSPIKINIICSNIFSVFLGILILIVMQSFLGKIFV